MAKSQTSALSIFSGVRASVPSLDRPNQVRLSADGDGEWNDSQPDKQGDTLLEEKHEVKEPSLYRVVLLNDDYTSMEFVVFILTSVFQKSPSEAEAIMMRVHNAGEGLAGIYVKEVAETKIAKVHALARQEEVPLKCRMDRE